MLPSLDKAVGADIGHDFRSWKDLCPKLLLQLFVEPFRLRAKDTFGTSTWWSVCEFKSVWTFQYVLEHATHVFVMVHFHDKRLVTVARTKRDSRDIPGYLREVGEMD